MNTPATPTADDARNRVETYQRTDSDGRPQLILYDRDEPQAWLLAAQSSAVEPENQR
ncbi:hypothetical protein [Halorussus litoreus]|uniref:hypothetical protein n=1 Tax=Halorussus litoreus TaxID=1710536 RepID=UPI0013008CB6|nr:hypothetical protein [Halorussus litoreus]